MTQTDLFTSDYADRDRARANPTRWEAQETNSPQFAGATFDAEKDGPRLNRQFDRVFEVMKHGQWWTLWELQDLCGGTQTGISARIRDFKKEKFGSHTVNRRRRNENNLSDGTFEYQLIVNQ